MFIYADEVTDDSRKHSFHTRAGVDIRFMKYANALFVNTKDYLTYLEVDNSDSIDKFKALIPKTWGEEYEKVWLNVDLYLKMQKILNPNTELN